MLKILKYSFYDQVRSKWLIVYTLFFLTAGYMILYLGTDLSKAIASLMNLTLILTPLIGTIFGVTSYYNSREFIELLLAQPLRRNHIFLGMYFGFSVSLSLAFFIGLVSFLGGLLLAYIFKGKLASNKLRNAEEDAVRVVNDAERNRISNCGGRSG